MRSSGRTSAFDGGSKMSLSSTTKMPRVWDVPGRGTAAGRALFRLYNGCAAARHKGEGFSLQNRLNMLRRMSLSAPPAPEVSCDSSSPNHKPKVTVRVPRFRRKARPPEDAAAYPAGGGKRKASLILEKAREEFEKMTLPPPPNKPVLDDKEKKRLQTIFEWHGLLKEGEVLAAPKPKTSAVPVRKGSKEEKEQLMDAISKEIQEREDFLQDMQQLGKDDVYRTQIQSEILDRVKQMKKLDKLLSAEEAQLAKSVTDVILKRDEDCSPRNSRKSVSWDT